MENDYIIGNFPIISSITASQLGLTSLQVLIINTYLINRMAFCLELYKNKKIKIPYFPEKRK